MSDLLGKPVTEQEAAIGLGFASVAEMRRWETEMGQKVANLEQELHTTASDRDQFLWAGKRMAAVLERVRLYLTHGEGKPEDICLAIDVVLGKAVDWTDRLSGWFEERRKGVET